MNRRIAIFLSSLIMVLTYHIGQSQGTDSLIQKRNDFVGEINESISYTKMSSAIQLANEFAAFFDTGGLSAAQKEQLEKTYKNIKERKLPVNPYLIDYLRAVNLSKDNEMVMGEELLNLFTVLAKVTTYESNSSINLFFKNLNEFLQHRAFRYSNGYKLLVQNGTVSFDYIEGITPIEGEPVSLLDEKENEEVVEAYEEGETWEPETIDSSGDNWATDNNWATNDNWATDNSWGNNDGWGNDDGWGADNNASNDPWGSSSDTQNNGIIANQGPSADELLLQKKSGNSQAVNDEGMIKMLSNYELPVAIGPLIKIDGFDLGIITYNDSVTLQSTSGWYELLENKYYGQGGTFDWQSQGLSETEVFASLGKYFIDVRKGDITSEASYLTYRNKFEGTIEGRFEYKNIRRPAQTASSYPRFTSYRSDIQVYLMADKDFSYKGGFCLLGNKIFGKNVLDRPAHMELTANGRKYFKAVSKGVLLNDSLVSAKNTSITVYHQQDSITHPAVDMYYNPNTRQLEAYKSKGVFKLSPYVSSYYKMEIEADMIKWNLERDSLDILISSAKNIVPAYFESKDYFNKEDLHSLEGIYGFNPLIMVVYYARKIKKPEFLVDDLAKHMKQNENAVRSSMVGLMQNGFIDYDINSGLISINEKALHFVDSDKLKRDFDDLKIKSVSPNKPNATLNIENSDLTIRGIDRFNVSQLLNVYILPTDNEITLMKDRDMKFNGQLFAGNFEFIGREFLFNYDSFYVDMNQIDSIRFYIEDLETGQKKMVDNKLVSADTSSEFASTQDYKETSGRLFINRPDNKSGNKIYPNYPRFNAEQGAIVYFEGENILDGAYDKSIYFMIPPFEIDSLSDSDPAAIGFKGVFIAEGILPQFEETLHIMDDNTMGFVHSIPPEGYTLYNGNGRLYNQLTMDKDGLHAKGNIEYMSSSMQSEKFTFYIDSLTGVGTDFVMDKGDFDGGSFPDASVENFRLKWLPKEDRMFVYNLEEPLTLYDNTATLDGAFVVSKSGGLGQGTLFTRGAEAHSEEFSFNETKFGARHATFEIKSDNPEKPALAGDDIRLNFNLIDNYADIGPEIEGMAAITFPYAQFKTSISNARWNLDDRTVVMNKPDNVDISNSYFYATREELDSLSFNATKAVYDMDKLELLVSGIPFITVADARITPENNEVLILENARIGTLHNTNIVIDTLNEYHKLYNGTIDIISRNKFEGNATYEFVNAVNDTFAIKIDEFELIADDSKGRNKQLHTQALGYIFEDDGVVISPGMVYKGEAIMYAPDPAFKLNGYVKLEYRENPLDEIWIRYQSSETKTQEVKFDFQKARTEHDDPLIAGIHFDDTDRLYSTFINPKNSILDQDFFKPSGILSYDPDSSTYRIQDTLKVIGKSYSGRIFNLNVKSSDIEFEGPLNFNLMTKDLALTGAGIGTGNMAKNEYSFNGFLTYDIKLPTQALDIIGQEMMQITDVLGLELGYSDDPRTLYKVAEIIGEKATVDFEQKSLADYTSLVSISPRLLKTIVIADINMIWHKEQKAWYNVGQIGLSNIGKDDVNARVDGFMEIRKGESGDIVNLFLLFSSENWYYFNFEENRLITVSTNEDYLNVIADKSTSAKANFGEYFFLDGDNPDVTGFIDRFRSTYLGIDEPYDFEFAPSRKMIPTFQDPEVQDDGFGIPDQPAKEEEDDDGF